MRLSVGGFDMVYGRSAELTILENDYRKNNSSIVTLYGRRRIGKSSLVAFYVKDKSSFCFEAIEGQNTKEQISHFINQLKTQYKDELFESLRFENWDQVFKYLSSILAKRSQEKKTVIYFDELQWMAAGQSKLIGLLKYFWDNSWKKYNIQLILCGSIASFMLEKVIHSKALYGRIDIELQIKELNLASLSKIKKNKISKKDCLLYNMIFGGIPKYFELIKPEFPVAHNIQAICFSEEGYLFNEYRKIFYSQFKEYLLYEKIISYLLKYPHSLKEISLKLKIASGGGLKRYLDILEKSRFVRSYSSVLKGGGKEIKYKVFDEYLIFYLKYIKPSQKILSKISDKNYFKSHIESQWRPWLGIAFENYCLKNIENIINRLEILDEVIDVGPYFEKNTDSFQIDILIKVKNGDAYLCECKYRDEKITSEVIVEVERKRNLIENKISGKIKPILIAPNGASNELVSSEYFYQILTLNDLWLD